MVANADSNRERIMAHYRWGRWEQLGESVQDAIIEGLNRDMDPPLVRETRLLIDCVIDEQTNVLLRVWELGVHVNNEQQTWYIARDAQKKEWARARTVEALRQLLWRMPVPE